MKKFALGLAAFISFTFLVPVPASANAACTGSECVASFQYTGTEQQWSVPAGATNIRFFVYGASGARGGGGGSVTGVLNNLPSVLYLYVGGQGSQGRNASGGFNGGGSAGGNRGNEGSGGGASDIRSSQALSSRIVVAGGGGGGADDNDCCADGGGGGGGSSYANSSFTQNVSHAAGVNSGHGRIEIHYTLIPIVTSFSGAQASSVSATFTMVVSEAITNLDQSDFVVSGCSWKQLSISGNSALITLASCSHGNVSLTLKASSLGALQNGPPQPVVAAIQFDGQAPSFTWSASGNAFSESSVVLGFSVQEATISSIAKFDLGGCQGELLNMALRIFGCPDGTRTISFGPNQLTDSWGNSGPANAVSYQVIFDQTAPVATWSNVQISGTSTFSYSAVINFSESVSFSVSSVVFTSSMECIRGDSSTSAGWFFWAECGFGSGSWLLPALSLRDALGNFGPLEPISVSFENLAPPPVPASAPQTESQVVTTPTQTQSPVVTTPPQEQQNPQPTQPPATEPVTQAPGPEPTAQPEPPVAADPQPVEVVIETPRTESPVVEEVITGSEEVEMAPVGFDDVPTFVTQDSPEEVLTQQRPISPKTSGPQLSDPAAISESPVLDDLPVEEPLQLTANEFTFRQEDEFPILPVALAALGLLLLLGLVVIRISGR